MDKNLDFVTVCNITTKNRTSSFLDFREALGKHLIIVMREEGGLLIPSWMTKNPIKISVRFFGFADKDDKSFFWQRDKIMKTLNTSYVSKYFSPDKFTESLDRKMNFGSVCFPAHGKTCEIVVVVWGNFYSFSCVY